MYNWKKALALVLAMVMVLAIFVACKDKDGDEGLDPVVTDAPTAAPVDPGTPTEEPAPVEKPTYTYNTMLGASPVNWNPHQWETNADNVLAPYIESPFVDITIAEDGVNWAWVFEAANTITDITADFADKEMWGIEADADGEFKHRVYQIDLNPLCTWDDGTPINADSYIYSMQQLLSPEMKNYRANTYFNGDSAILNALGYFNNDLVGQEYYIDANGLVETEYYMNLNELCVFFGSDAPGAYYEHASYGPAYFTDANGVDIYAKYTATEGYILVTDEVKADLVAVGANFGDTNPECWIEFCFAKRVYEETPWEKVGLYKVDDYTLIYILENECSPFYFNIAMTSTWLVKEDLYEGGKKTQENLVATDYNTSAETTASFGPYKLVSFEVDKQFVLERNEAWFGYTDGKHEGQYMTDRIVYNVVGEHNTALQLFLQGNLDGIELTGDDMPVYRMSDYLLKTDQTYTFRFIFASDPVALASLEDEAGDGANKRVLQYDDFRKAISLSMDRARFANEATSAYKPAYYLLNYLYYYDIENNADSQYRNTKEAKDAVLRLYGIEYGEGTAYATEDEAFAAITGYDVEEAKALFQAVYTQAIADGNYTDGQEIKINCMCSAASSMSADDTKQQDLLNEFVTAATVGTGFEGKITFTFQSGSSTRYADVAAGKVEMIRGAWGGAAFYPFSTIRVYCEPEYMGGMDAIHESNGWDPTVETLTITYDFNKDGTPEEVTDTLQNWAINMNGSGLYATDPDALLVVLSNLETAILSSYQCIPWASETLCELFSKKVEWATLDYNIMYGYGGLRLMTYNYNDAEWAAYVAEQGGQLNYE